MSTTHAPAVTINTTSYGRERITIGDYSLVIVPRDCAERHAWKPTRVHGAIDALGGELAELLEVNSMKPVSGPGRDDFANDAERNAHMREYRLVKRRLTAHVREQLVEIFETFDAATPALLGLRDTKMKFSIHAGCTMCPCSPGFILSNTVIYRGEPVDIHVEKVVTDDNACD